MAIVTADPLSQRLVEARGLVSAVVSVVMLTKDAALAIMFRFDIGLLERWSQTPPLKVISVLSSVVQPWFTEEGEVIVGIRCSSLCDDSREKS